MYKILIFVAATLVTATSMAQVGPPSGAPSRPKQVPDTMAQRVLACVGCHGSQGRATSSGYFPRIAGKPAGYLYNQLISFRDGRRYNPAMKTLLENLSDDYLHDIADHFAQLDLPHPPPQAEKALPAELALGERLIHQGDSARGVPACAKCHGKTLMGRLPAIPGLLGLPRDYLIAQLGSWQTGQRRAARPDCMAEIVKRLSPADIGNITTWLATQIVPSGRQAEAPLSPADIATLGISCGSGFQ